MKWLLSVWYQAGWSDEIALGGMLARTLLDTPLLLFRGESGTLSAVLDRCPHRFAPISKGRVEGEAVRCGYHGLTFDGNGRCIANPHGSVTSSMNIRGFPVVERHKAMWVWMGDADKADLDLLPDFSFIDETPESACIRGYMPTKANYQLVSDNIMDLSHADYLHPTTLGGMMTSASTRIVERNGHVITEWAAVDCANPPAVFRAKVPAPANADITISVDWQAPAVMTLAASARPSGTEPKDTDKSLALHNMTPETETTTHYFYCATRRSRVDDTESTAFLRKALEQAFLQEDKPLLEAQQARMGTSDLWALKPALLSIDNGPVRARRLLDKRIAAEG